MKANHLIRWIRIVLLCLAWLVSLVAIPLLAKAAANWMGDSIKLDQYDISPILVPVPPPMVSNEPIATATPAPSFVVVPVPVPTPPPSEAPTVSSIEEHTSVSTSLTGSSVAAMDDQAVVTWALTILIVLILICMYRISSLHSLHGRNA